MTCDFSKNVPRWTSALANTTHWVGLLALMAITGCGNGEPQVTGTVTLDGSPLGSEESTKLVDVTFSPLSGGTMATGRADSRGRYRLSTGATSGIAAGKYAVTVLGRQFTPSADEGAPPSVKMLTPAHYASPTKSGFEVEVKAGSNSFDFDLTTDS